MFLLTFPNLSLLALYITVPAKHIKIKKYLVYEDELINIPLSHKALSDNFLFKCLQKISRPIQCFSNPVLQDFCCI